MLEPAIPLISGAFAGLAVDLSLFPLDTLKTRLQAKGGFFANGGWRGVYKGMGSIAAGSAPSAALFFLTYEACKKHVPLQNDVALAVVAGSAGETLACLVRTPTEVVKQRTQTSKTPMSSLQTLRAVLQANGVAGLYRGFGGTLAREIPFVCIQFPLWEALKRWAVSERGGSQPHPTLAERPQANAAEAAICGAMAGGVAAALTTPMDVVKTRLMLSDSADGWFRTLQTVVKEEGLLALSKGIVPRIGWISTGGFIFLGGYSAAKDTLEALAGVVKK
ncbi:mitochondrial carrier domain-containing protein [Protomyces lactucae-debilis]|uniref:Mitochondrial carrier domain-containing protein n=1 Tax=Protomyces lactucae-debilis TaxID=2754530 RepID=A0A1Y2FGN6_PROLT|nr:mitochondrial carrier domain-containing protein [Protomyces lactucae-debilis]ORY83083.1 mitochondrial carrier domain-containing protein [Protomyces lactucae-debilis]